MRGLPSTEIADCIRAFALLQPPGGRPTLWETSASGVATEIAPLRETSRAVCGLWCWCVALSVVWCVLLFLAPALPFSQNEDPLSRGWWERRPTSY